MGDGVHIFVYNTNFQGEASKGQFVKKAADFRQI